MRTYWRLLQNKNFASLFLGQLISRLGDGIGAIVITWTVLETTNSALMVALSMLAQTIPQIFFSLSAGHAADRYKHRTLMIWADILRMAVTLGAAILGWTGGLNPWFLMLTAFAISIAGSFFGPARAAIMPHIIPKGDLQAANGIMTGSFHAAALVGPLLGGWLLRSMDAGTLLLVDSITFAVSILGLVILPATVSATGSQRRSVLAQAREGVYTVWRTPSLVWVVGTFWVGTFFVGGFFEVGRTLMIDWIGAGSMGLGLMSTAMGVGLMLGSLWVGKADSPYKTRTVLMAWARSGVLVALFGLMPGMTWVLVLTFLAGFNLAYINVPTSTLIQMHGDKNIGKITGYWTVSIWIGESASLALAAPFFERLQWQNGFILIGSLLAVLAALAAYLAWRVSDDLNASTQPVRQEA